MSSRLNRTYDTDVITLRNVFTSSNDNTSFPIGYVLTTDQNGIARFTDPLNISSINAISSLVGILPNAISTISTNFNNDERDQRIVGGVCTMSTNLYAGLSSLSVAIANISVIATTNNIDTVSTVPTFQIGGSSTAAARRFKGSIDYIQLYSAAISTSQIQQSYFLGLNNLYRNNNFSLKEFNQRIVELKNNLSSN